MNAFHNSTTHADNRFIVIVIAIVLATVLSVGVIGPESIVTQLDETMDGAAFTNYIVEVGEALGTG